MGDVATLEVVELGRLTESQRAELVAAEEDPFDAAGNTLRWRRKDRHVALRRSDGRLVASAGLVLGELQAEDEARHAFVGIGGVFVTARYRGRGLGRRIVSEALRHARTLGPEIALLFCHRDRAALYERHGFVKVEPPVLVEQPGGYAEVSLVTMWRTLRRAPALPPGGLTIHSLPF